LSTFGGFGAFIFEVSNLRPLVSSHVSGERRWFQSNMEDCQICRQHGERRPTLLEMRDAMRSFGS
jgi:hypothetical protein